MIDKGATGDVADDFYHLYEKDIIMMKDLGIKHFRFSISWGRILPLGTVEGGISWEGVDFYNRMIDFCLENDVEPVVTIFHWDLPQALNTPEIPAWYTEDLALYFRDYAE